MDVVFIIGRVVLALYFISGGLNHLMKREMLTGYAQSKGLSAPGLMVMLSGLALILGGLALLLGVFVFWALWGLIIFLVLVAFIMHRFWADQDPQTKMNDMINFRAALALAAALAMLFMIPEPWPFALF